MFSRLRAPVLIIGLLLACAARNPDATAKPAAGATPVGTKGLVHVSSTGEKEVFPVRVLSVGISDFPSLSAEDDLTSGERDARWFVDELQKVMDIDYPVVVLGKDATKDRVLSEVEKIVAGAGPKDVVILYFATQSGVVGKKGYLFSSDTNPEGKVQYTGIGTEAIKDAIKRSKARQVVVLADAVHQPIKSGSGFKSGPQSTVGSVLAEIGEARKDVLTIPGGSVGPRPDDPCAGHSVFTCAVVAALQGRADLNNDGIAELAEIVSTVPGAVASSARADSGERRSEPGGDVSTSMGVPVIQKVRDDSANPVQGATWQQVKMEDIRVCYLANDEVVPVNHVYRTGDEFAIRVTAPATGELAMYNVGPDGKVSPLFPWGAEDTRIFGGTAKQVMPADHPDPIVFVDPVGLEKVYVLWQPERYGRMDQQKLLAIAEERAASGVVAEADKPDERWKAGTKGLTHLTQVAGTNSAGGKVSGASTGGVAVNASVASSDDGCNVYRPQQQGEGWVVELTLDHR